MESKVSNAVPTLASSEACCRWLLCVVQIPSLGIEHRLMPNSSHKSTECPDGGQNEKNDIGLLWTFTSIQHFFSDIVRLSLRSRNPRSISSDTVRNPGQMPGFPAFLKARNRLGNGTTSPPQTETRSQRYSQAASGLSRVYDRDIGRAEPH